MQGLSKRAYSNQSLHLLKQANISSANALAALKHTAPSGDADSKIPKLSFGLDRVLFNPGAVHPIQCPRTGLYNFLPALQSVLQPEEFNWSLLRSFVPASQDVHLHAKAREVGAKIVTSTSSLSGALSLLYFCLFGLDKGPHLQEKLSMQFANEPLSFTNLSKAPISFLVEPIGGNGNLHSVVIEKVAPEDDSIEGTAAVQETILMKMGHILEKKLTTSPAEFEAYRLNRTDNLPESRMKADQSAEAFAFCQLGSLLVRSQIDAADSRLPGKLFDIKTRASLPIRMNSANWSAYTDYKIFSPTGLYNSYEREYYDMARSAFLKYSFQVALGGMDGIFVAFHNIVQIFGFQYISLQEMEQVLYGNSSGIGKVCFGLLLKIYEQLMSTIIESVPFRNEKFRISLDVKVKGLDIWVERCPLDNSFSQLTIPPSLQHFRLGVYALVNGIRAEALGTLFHQARECADSLVVNWQLVQQRPPAISDYLAMKKRMMGQTKQIFDVNGAFMRKIVQLPKRLDIECGLVGEWAH